MSDRPPNKPDRHLKKFDIQIAKTALKHLCKTENRQSSLKNLKEEVESTLRRQFRFSILPVLKKFDSNFIIVCDNDNKNTIKPRTTLELCPLHCGNSRNCNGYCNKLHICKFFLLSDCKIVPQSKCRFGHVISSDHNRRLLEYHDLEDLEFEHLRNLFRNVNSRHGVTKPPICKFYNKTGCTKGDNCKFIHICITYIQDEACGRRCGKNHNICHLQVKGILQQYGMDTKDAGSVLSLFRSCYSYKDDPDSDVSDSSSDCSDFSDSDDGSDSTMGVGAWNRYHTSDMYHGNKSGYAEYMPHKRREDTRFKKNSRGGRGRGLSSASSWSRSYEYEGFFHDFHGDRHDMFNDGQNNSRFPRGGVSRAKSNPCLCGSFGSQLSLVSYCGPKSDNSTEICIFFLKGDCRYGNNCNRQHKNSMFQWQYREAGGGWKDFWSDANISIERQYCNASTDEHIVQFRRQGRMSLDFRQMTGRKKGVLCEIRRIATESTAVQKFQPLATEYKWFWQDQRERWILYGEKNLTGYSTKADSEFIEMNFQENPGGQMKFNTSGHDYIMDFPRMVQRNLVHRTERSVRRRPVFVSPEEIEVKKRRSSDMSEPGSSSVALSVASPLAHDPVSYIPKSWTIKKRCTHFDIGNHFQLVTCPRSGQEDTEIKRLFYETMPKSLHITSIKRIENGDLWLSFMTKREKMKRKRSAGKEVKEFQLFHGTNEDIVDAISRQGFDFRFSGSKTGHKYGKGSYFARMAQTADSYTDSGKKKHIFVVRVLAGDFALGEASYVRPPPRNPKDPFELFDSCVDNIQNPNIFVIFTFDQVYPEYVIEYQKR